MKIQLWVVGLLAIASASCTAGAVTNATPSTPISPSAIAVPSDSANISRQAALAGTWSSGLMIVTFNWNAGTYSGVMLGEPFSKNLEFISETENEVVFETDGSRLVGQFQADGEVKLIQNRDSSTALLLRRD